MPGIGNYKKGKKFELKSGNKPSFFKMGSSPMKTDYISDKKNYAIEDYQAGVAHIKAAMEAGASKQEVRNLVVAHNKATRGKKYKKGAQRNPNINFAQITRGQYKTEKPVEKTTPRPFPNSPP